MTDAAEEDRKARRLAEQRVSPRIPMGAPALLTWGGQRMTGYVENLNLGGLYVATPRVPELGEYVDLTFAVPANGRNFHVRASVVHTRRSAKSRSGFGARFERPPLGFLEAIKSLKPSH